MKDFIRLKLMLKSLCYGKPVKDISIIVNLTYDSVLLHLRNVVVTFPFRFYNDFYYNTVTNVNKSFVFGK